MPWKAEEFQELLENAISKLRAQFKTAGENVRIERKSLSIVLPQGLSYASQRSKELKGQILGGAFFVQTRYPKKAIAQQTEGTANVIRRPSYVFSLREGEIIRLADLEQYYRQSVQKLAQIEPGQIDVFIDVVPYNPEKASFQIDWLPPEDIKAGAGLPEELRKQEFLVIRTRQLRRTQIPEEAQSVFREHKIEEVYHTVQVPVVRKGNKILVPNEPEAQVHFITFGGPYVREVGPLRIYRNRLTFKELVARASGRTELAEELARRRAEIEIAQRNQLAQQKKPAKEAKQVGAEGEQPRQEAKQASQESEQATQERQQQPQDQTQKAQPAEQQAETQAKRVLSPTELAQRLQAETPSAEFYPSSSTVLLRGYQSFVKLGGKQFEGVAFLAGQRYTPDVVSASPGLVQFLIRGSGTPQELLQKALGQRKLGAVVSELKRLINQNIKSVATTANQLIRANRDASLADVIKAQTEFFERLKSFTDVIQQLGEAKQQPQLLRLAELLRTLETAKDQIAGKEVLQYISLIKASLDQLGAEVPLDVPAAKLSYRAINQLEGVRVTNAQDLFGYLKSIKTGDYSLYALNVPSRIAKVLSKLGPIEQLEPELYLALTTVRSTNRFAIENQLKRFVTQLVNRAGVELSDAEIESVARYLLSLTPGEMLFTRLQLKPVVAFIPTEAGKFSQQKAILATAPGYEQLFTDVSLTDEALRKTVLFVPRGKELETLMLPSEVDEQFLQQLEGEKVSGAGIRIVRSVTLEEFLAGKQAEQQTVYLDIESVEPQDLEPTEGPPEQEPATQQETKQEPKAEESPAQAEEQPQQESATQQEAKQEPKAEEPAEQAEKQPATEQQETGALEQPEQARQAQADQQTSAQEQAEQALQQEQTTIDQTRAEQEQVSASLGIEEQVQSAAKGSGALSETDRQVFETALQSSGLGQQQAREIPPDPTQLHYDPNVWSRIYGFEGLDEAVKRTQPPSDVQVEEEIVQEATESESKRGHFLREWLESLARYLFGTPKRTAITLGVIGGVTAIALTGYVQRRKVRRDIEQQLAKQRAIAAVGLPNRSYTPTAVRVQADVYADYYDQQAGPYVAQNYGFGRSEITVNRYRR